VRTRHPAALAAAVATSPTRPLGLDPLPCIAQTHEFNLPGAWLLDFGQKKTIYVFLPNKQVQDIYFSRDLDHETYPLSRSF
jgi:hypothetical protein